MSELKKSPSWKQAANEFLDDFKYGDMVTHAWMEQRFGMPSITESHRMTVEQFRERQFEWLANVEAFKAEVLKEHQVCLQSVRGEGYRWVPPHEQTSVAVKEFESSVSRVFRTAGNKLRNLRHLELTDDQRRSNMDAIAKVSALTGMSNKALR